MRVLLNPGHAPDGRPDPGAVNRQLGARECDVALDVALKTAHYLTVAGVDAEIFQNDSLEAICEEEHAGGYDLFVSIHCNAANGAARGTECFYFDGGKHLAGCIQEQIVDSLRTFDRGVKQAGFYVLKYTWSPAVLVELEFIDNNAGATLLLTSADEFAKAIARGVTDYLQGLE